jgi:hypothetical protein
MSASSFPALSPLFTGRWDAVVAEKARNILLSAILPVLLLTTALDMWRFKRTIAEAPGQRRLRSWELRPP